MRMPRGQLLPPRSAAAVHTTANARPFSSPKLPTSVFPVSALPQGFTLAALGAIAAVTFLEEGTATPRTSEERLPGATAGVAAAK